MKINFGFIVLSLFFFLNSVAQPMQVNDLGIGKIQLGKPVHLMENMVPFSSCSLKDTLDVIPTNGLFYVYKGEAMWDQYADIKVNHIIVSSDKEGIINMIFLIVTDPLQQLEKALNQLFPGRNTIAIGESSIHYNRHLFWYPGSGSEIYTLDEARSIGKLGDRLLSFRVQKDTNTFNCYISIKPKFK